MAENTRRHPTVGIAILGIKPKVFDLSSAVELLKYATIGHYDNFKSTCVFGLLVALTKVGRVAGMNVFEGMFRVVVVRY